MHASWACARLAVMKALRLATLFIFAALLAMPAGTAPTDDNLVDQIRVKLTQDVDVNGGALDVAVKDGVVTLAGPVRNEKAKKKAEKIAMKIKGVKSVVNKINVSLP